ncbi:MAG: DUF4125 family protein [Lachnospiraceae bacterium]|nr:DUF4125 family protein [Lachnospiraceae bacterium]
MDLNQVMGELDELFTQERISEIPQFLESHIAQADAEGAQDILLMLYNECIGFYREVGQYEQSIAYCNKAVALMNEMGLENTLPYATTLLNAANAHRAAGMLSESLELYNQVKPIYAALLDKDDMYFAGLYNNLSLLYQEMGNFEAAKEQLENALYIVNHNQDTQFEAAVTQANLANTCIELGQDDEAKARAEEAIRIFEEIGVDDAHYSAALSALGSLYYMEKDYPNALNAMEKSRECVAKYLGADNIQYQRLSENIEIIKDKMNGEAAAANATVEVKIQETCENTAEEAEEQAEAEERPEAAETINQPGLEEQPEAAETINQPEQKDDAGKSGETIEAEDLTPDISGLELCRRYYEEYGRPMIAEKFHAYESCIAVGLVGKGSDCFGFDDIQSRDHDFGPRFVMWVTRKVYDEIGEELQEAYEKLPRSFMGVDRVETFHGRDRAGVMVIEEFYKNTLGCDLIGKLQEINESSSLDKENLNTIECWLSIQDYALAAAVNGAVFRDDEGIFTAYRNRLCAYYPKAVWYRKLAQSCALFSQNGQYNLPRMRRRGQTVAAELAKAECIRQAMKLYYLLNRTYAPHDKWLFKGMPDNPDMSITDEEGRNQSTAALVERLSLLPADKAHENELAAVIESLAVIFANELERRNIIGQCELYLDACTSELTEKSDALLTAIVADTPVITALSLSIAKAEFEAFDKVQNEGGRASCQNNWPTFKVMRMSQYMTWTEDMLLQYLYEFKTNYANGRNMIEEKYARMMESTAPLEYARFADRLPPVSDEKKAIIEQIVALQVKWMEEFAAEYPRLAGNARIIHTADDMPYDTSYETYLRGELGTYSDRMLDLYGRYIVEHAQNGKNVAREIMENTIHFYGYQDFETANEKGI